MKEKFLNNLRTGFVALAFSVIAFFFLNTRESSYVTTDSDEHLITAHFIENDLRLTGTLGESGSKFTPFFYSRIGFSVLVAGVSKVNHLVFPDIDLIDHNIYTIIGSTFISLWIFIFGFLKILEKKNLGGKKSVLSILLLFLVIILLKPIVFTSNLLLAGLFLLFLSSEKQASRGIFSILAVITRFEIVFLILALEAVRKNWSSSTVIFTSFLFSIFLANGFGQIELLENYNFRIFILVMIITISILVHKRLKMINNAFNFEILLSFFYTFLISFHSSMQDLRYFILTGTLLIFLSLEIFFSLKLSIQRKIIFSYLWIGISAIFLISNINIDWKSPHEKYLQEFPYILAKEDFLENCEIEKNSVIVSPYGESLFTVTGRSIIAIKDYATISNDDVIEGNKNYYLVYNSYIKDYMNLEKSDFLNSEVCKYEKSSLLNLGNTEGQIIKSSSLIKLEISELDHIIKVLVDKK